MIKLDSNKKEEQKLKIYSKRVGIFIDVIPPTKSIWYYFVLRKTSRVFGITVGKMNNDIYKKKEKLLVNTGRKKDNNLHLSIFSGEV